jgi:hypothetical protein
MSREEILLELLRLGTIKEAMPYMFGQCSRMAGRFREVDSWLANRIDYAAELLHNAWECLSEVMKYADKQQEISHEQARTTR